MAKEAFDKALAEIEEQDQQPDKETTDLMQVSPFNFRNIDRENNINNILYSNQAKCLAPISRSVMNDKLFAIH